MLSDDVMLDRSNRNSEIRDRYFTHPEFRRLFLDFLMITYDDFRAQAR